jgi:tetratricopeptide (TPR) repeat protein
MSIIKSTRQTAELENEEPLSVMFQRAVVLQRAGSHEDALDEYTLFLKAAKQCQVDPSMYAEVYGNMGALYLRKQQYDLAREHLQLALDYRPKLGTAHVNLAVVALQQASATSATTSLEANEAIVLVESAKNHCNNALDCNTDPRSVAMAQRLLEDIDKMLSSPLG